MIKYIHKKGIFCSTLLDTKIFHGFGTKILGNGIKKETVQKILKKYISHPVYVIIPQQIHSTHVEIVDQTKIDQRYTYIAASDALVTKEKNVLLTVLTVDCVPIIYADVGRSVIGISHGGWKGTLENIAKYVIDRMIELGARKEHIIAAVGPAIADCCYRIYGLRRDEFIQAFGDRVIRYSGDRTFLNLLAANIDLLLAAGILRKNIDYSLFCTSCDEQRFWSFHRDHVCIGEMLHYVMLR